MSVVTISVGQFVIVIIVVRSRPWAAIHNRQAELVRRVCCASAWVASEKGTINSDSVVAWSRC